MANDNEINIESIMQEIRQDIRDKGYTNDLLSFNDIVIDTSTINAVKFDKVAFNEEVYTINHGWNIQAYRPVPGGRIAVFFKKVMRKLVYWFVEPIVMEQDGFNAAVVRMMNQMNCYIEETTKENAELKKQVEELTKKLEK